MTRIHQLFIRFTSIWGYKFTSPFETREAIAAAKTEWLDALSGLTDQQIMLGIERCRSRCEWPPSLPEFMRHCRGIADEATCVRRAIAGEDDNISRLIRSRIGSWKMSHSSEKELVHEAKSIYAELMDEIAHSDLKQISHEQRFPALQ